VAGGGGAAGLSVSGSEDGGKAGAVGLTGASISRAWCETESRRIFRLRAFHWLAAAGRRGQGVSRTSCSRVGPGSMDPRTGPILEAAAEFLWSDELEASLDVFARNHAPMFANATGPQV
jgi:hypothetical protein